MSLAELQGHIYRTIGFAVEVAVGQSMHPVDLRHVIGTYKY